MPKSFLIGLFAFLGWILPAQAQFIAQPQPILGVCPNLCPGSEFGISLPAVQDLGTGTEILAELSDPNGSFSGTTYQLPVVGWTTVVGGSFTPGTYRFSQNLNNLQLLFRVPAAAPAGDQYTLRMRTSNGYVGQSTLPCVGSQFTVLPGGPRLAPMALNTFGQNQWYAHLYTWARPIEGGLDSLSALNFPFFRADQYLGHVVYDRLNFDKTITGFGYPGTDHDGTSLGCDANYLEYISLQMLRRQTFDTGFYAFTIAGDDGIRFSIDSGRSWLLSSFQEQPYDASERSTFTRYPKGICLAGTRPLVTEFFQSGLDSRLTLDVTKLPTPTTTTLSQTRCEGTVLSLPSGFEAAGNRFQWQISLDGGTTYADLADTGVVRGSQKTALVVNRLTLGWNNALVRCLLYNSCARQGFVATLANLTVQPGVFLRRNPLSRRVCVGEPVGFGVAASGPGITYQWEISTDGGSSFSDITGSGFTGFTTDSLQWMSPAADDQYPLFRCRVQGTGACLGPFYSDTASLRVQQPLSITRQPDDQGICYGDSSVFLLEALGANLRYRWERRTPTGNFESIPNTLARLSIRQSPPDIEYYRCRVESDCGPALYSREAMLLPCEDSCAFPRIPNILTPNNDGLNELFASYPACGYESYDLSIYNRWGSTVFTTQNRQGWQPQNLPAGTYFYRLQFRYFGRNQQRHGFVELVR